MDEVLLKYARDLKDLDQDALAKELAGLISVAPKFAPYLECLVRELESRVIN